MKLIKKSQYVILLFIFMAMTILTTGRAYDLPDAMSAINPESECEFEGQAKGWKVKGYLLEKEGISYLALYFDPGFSVDYEPWFDLKTGMAVFIEKKGHIYYYHLGKLTKARKIGRMSFYTKTPETILSHDGSSLRMKDRVATMDLERREGTHCIRFIERKSISKIH